MFCIVDDSITELGMFEQARFSLGSSHLTSTKLNEAYQTFKNAVECHSENSSCWNGLGATFSLFRCTTTADIG